MPSRISFWACGLSGGTRGIIGELLHFKIDVAALQSAAFLLGEVGQGLLVVGQGPDFLPLGGGQIVLIGQHFERGGLADRISLLFGIEGFLGVNTRLARSLHAFVTGLRLLHGIINLYQDILFLLFKLNQILLFRGFGGIVGIARANIG